MIVCVTPAYDKNGIAHPYEGRCWVEGSIVHFDPPPGKSAEGQPECLVSFFYETVQA